MDQIAVFPLNAPLYYPGRVLSLHIFEPRYRELMRDALAGKKEFAMGVFKPGWELDYAGRPPIHPIVCAGKIVKHQELPDGRFLLLLKGTQRARVLREYNDHSYRVADIERIVEPPLAPAIDSALKFQMEVLLQKILGRNVAPPCAPDADPPPATGLTLAEEGLLCVEFPIEEKMRLYSIECPRERAAAILCKLTGLAGGANNNNSPQGGPGVN